MPSNKMLQWCFVRLWIYFIALSSAKNMAMVEGDHPLLLHDICFTLFEVGNWELWTTQEDYIDHNLYNL